MREVIVDDGTWLLSTEERYGLYYVGHTPKNGVNGYSNCSLVWLSSRNMDALCAWWTAKKQAKEAK